MKRKLSLLLAVVMILSSFSFVFADEDFNVPAFLKKNGILVGNDDGDLMLDENLLRKDSVVLFARLLGKEAEAESFEMEGYPTFTDLAGNPYYDAFLAWAEYNEYFVGRPDGSFGYNDNLEAIESAIVLLRALGYTEEAADWDNAWETAKKLGLLKDIEVERRDLILREDVAQMIFNALSVTIKDSDQTLAEFLGIDMPEEPKAQELEAKVLDTENLAEIVVELSNADLVENKEALLNPHNYRINNSNNAQVRNVHLEGDNVILTLVPYGRVEEQGNFDTLVKGEKFSLTIRNIDPAINTTYRNIVAGDNEIPTIEKVEFIGTHGIKVTTSEPVLDPQERNFRVDDKRTSMIIEQYGRELILTPYHGGSFDEDATELVIEGLVDFAGYKQVKVIEEMELQTKDAPKVKEAYRSGDKLTVVFEEDIYRPSVKAKESRRELGNVSFVERRVTFHANTARKVDTNVAVYTFEREIPKDTVVVIEGVQNHSKETMEKEEVLPILYDDEYPPVIISKLDVTIRTTEDGKVAEDVTSSTGGLKIEFDKDIREFVEDDIDLGKHFTLYLLDVTTRGKRDAEEAGTAVKIKDVGRDYITLDFDNIVINNRSRDYDYVLEVRNFHDLAGNRMEREYIDFQVLPKADEFDVVKMNIYNETYFNRDVVEIVLEFNAYVDKASAENETNYYLDDTLAIDEAIVEKDGRTVTLVVYDTNRTELLEDYSILEISPRVRNLADTASVATRYWNLETREPADIDITEPVEKTNALIGAEEITAYAPANPTAIPTESNALTLNVGDKIIIGSEEFTVEDDGLGSADLSALLTAINAKTAETGIKADNTSGFKLIKDDGTDFEFTLISGSATTTYKVTGGTPVSEEIKQVIALTFDGVPAEIEVGMKVVIGDGTNTAEGEVTNIEGDVVTITLTEETANYAGTHITEMTVSKGNVTYTLTVKDADTTGVEIK